MKKLFTAIIYLLFISGLFAQMNNDKFGNEWINFDQSYYKVMVAKDGVYRLNYQALADAGVPVSSINSGAFQLFRLGAEVPIYVSGTGSLGNGDYIEFFGQQNRSELDQWLFENPEEQMLNPGYSLVTDTSAYFLTWSSDGERYTNVNNDLNNPPAKENFFMFEHLENFNSAYIKRRISSDGVSYSNYDRAEGYGTPFQKTQTITIQPSHVEAGAAGSILRVRFATNNNNHEQTIAFNGTEIFNESIPDYTVTDERFNIASSEITPSAAIKFEGLADPNDKQSVSIASLTYPRGFDFDGVQMAQFTIASAPQKKYLEIENFDAQGVDPILYDLSNGQRLIAKLEGGLVKVVLPASNLDRKLVLFSSGTGYTEINQMHEVNFIDYSQQAAEYIIISNNRLFSDVQGIDQVAAYAAYRNSSIGGGFDTMTVEVQQLYDQFAYGINRHPFSIKNFANQYYRDWKDTAKYFFIIGKGREYYNVRSTTQYNNSIPTFYVPTYGYPGSDNLLIAETNKNYPAIPFGRIAVSSPEDIRIYLDKVKALEDNQQNAPQTIAGRGWMKEILHLGGGSAGERDVIKSNLEGMENIIENNKFGGHVTSVFKNSSDPVQISESEEIFSTINQGVSIITFFGHSGVGTFDFNIDNPDNYDNYGKYPLMFSLGCYSGNIHTSSRGISERFVYYEDKGAIAFGATTGLGFVSALNRVNSKLYELTGGDYYNTGMGDIFKGTLANFDAFTDYPTRTLIQQFTLQGDPAVKLNPAPGPDYVVDASSITFEPSNLTASLDSFTINFRLTNLGFGVSDSIDIIIKQELPDGDLLTIVTDKIQSPRNEILYSYRIPSYKKAAVGQNKLYIEIDVNNQIEESPAPTAELNNELVNSIGIPGILFYVFDESANPIYPPVFSIVNTPSLTLKASTSNALSRMKKYVMEMDTTELFNSLIKTRTEIVQGGGVLKWTPEILLQDSTVYYWRVSPDSISPEEPFIWANSSFVYLPNSSDGWNQSHYYQYLIDDFLGIEINPNQEFSFGQNGVIIRLINKLWDPQDPPGFTWDLGHIVSSISPWPYFNEGISVYVGDSINGTGWLNPPGGDFGSVNAGWSRVFSFPTGTETERATLINFLDNVVQPNNYVLIFSVLKNFDNDFSPEEWAQDSINSGINIYSLLESEGAQLVRTMEDVGSVPYTLFYKKGKGVIIEEIALNKNDAIDTEAFLPLNRENGNIISTTIGPARTWESLHWNVSEIDNIADTNYVRLYGIDAEKNETVLIDNLISYDTSLSFVSAEQFPYLKLEFYAQDKEVRTAPRLDYWRVLYEGIPDAAINPNQLFSFKSDTLQQGEQMELELAIENVSNYDMDSLLVKLSIFDKENNEVVSLKRYEPLSKNGIVNTNFSIDTRNLNQTQQLVMEVNPNEDQPELYKFNNFAIKDFFIDNDRQNPILDVTFDGIHIMNGDIVSPKPKIFISLKDENEFLSLSDTSIFNVFIKYPGQETNTLIPIESDWIQFQPDIQGDNQNKALLEFNPIFDIDGTYELLIQAEDVSGNQSGDLDYKVTFEIITKSAISNLLNYPNPFTSSTQFVYTLTGEEIADYFKIQILTISGKIVREITQDEIGPLKIGTHMTDYRWDGTDEFGDRLANGTYLYRVIAKKADGSAYEAHDNGTNVFFKHGFGKMVILR